MVKSDTDENCVFALMQYVFQGVVAESQTESEWKMH